MYTHERIISTTIVTTIMTKYISRDRKTKNLAVAPLCLFFFVGGWGLRQSACACVCVCADMSVVLSVGHIGLNVCPFSVVSVMLMGWVFDEAKPCRMGRGIARGLGLANTMKGFTRDCGLRPEHGKGLRMHAC